MFTWHLVVVGLSIALGTGAAPQDPPVPELLQKGIYTEETVGDLEAAIRIYERIVKHASANRPHVAEALFRLGECYRKCGKKDLAARALETLVKDYADQTELAARARRLLPGNGESGLPIQAAPWTDGELLRFAVKLPSGKPVGDMTYSVRSTTVDGRKAWRMESCASIPFPPHQSPVLKFCRVDADQETYRPLRALMFHSQLGRARTVYTDTERNMTLQGPGEKAEPYLQKLSGVIYDNEQSMYLFRRLPLGKGYRADVPIAGRPGSVFTARLEVVGEETVTVPAGTFQCLKTVVSVMPTVETHWYTADAAHHIVKVKSGQAVLELVEIGRLERGPTHYEDPRAGLSLNAPRGWLVFESTATPGVLDSLVQIFPQEMKAWGTLRAKTYEGLDDVRARIDEHIVTRKKKHGSYTVRSDSWSTREIAGRTATTLVADFTDHGWKLVEYRAYVANGPLLYWFVFQVGRDWFGPSRVAFDSILASFRLGKGQ